MVRRPRSRRPRGGAVEAGARERILDAAVERIARDGIDEARIARIAMDAGVSTSLVHYHFETREALLAEALEHSYEVVGDQRIDTGEWPDHTSRLSAMVDQCLPYEGELERDWILWVELWLRAVRHPELRPTATRLYERMHDWLADAIAAGIEAGEFQQADAGALADRVLALCDGYGIRALWGDPQMDVQRARDEVWAALAPELGLEPVRNSA